MLSWSNISTVLLSSESMSFDIVEYFKQNKFMDEEDIDEIISESNNSKLLTAFNNMLLKMKQQYSEIYSHLHSLGVEMNINSLFTILCLANIFNIYYHDSKSLENNTIAKFYGIYDARLLKNYIEDSPREFLQSHFGILLNNVSSLLITKLGLSRSRTGPYTGTKKHGGSKSKKTRKIHKSK